MGKLFGTDGIRGIAGQTLTAELAFHVGQAVAAVLTEEDLGINRSSSNAACYEQVFFILKDFQILLNEFRRIS